MHFFIQVEQTDGVLPNTTYIVIMYGQKGLRQNIIKKKTCTNNRDMLLVSQ